MVARAGGRGNEVLLFSRYGVSIWESEKKVLETEGGDGCKTCEHTVLNPIKLYTMAKMVNFMLCIYDHNYLKIKMN